MRIAQISVLVATRERPERLERCIRGVLHGEVLPAEIVVVEDRKSTRLTPVTL